jgi:putative transposase
MSARTFARDFKLDVCRQMSNGGRRPSQICREHSLSASMVTRWKNEYKERGENSFTPRDLGEPSCSEAFERRIGELERHCGQLSLENALLKKLVATLPSRGDTR